MSVRMFVLATACLVALIACDAKTSAVDPGFAPPKPDASPKAEPSPKAEAKVEEGYCATLLTTFDDKTKIYYYTVIEPCVKADDHYNTNIAPYLKEFKAKFFAKIGQDFSTVSIVPAVYTREEALKKRVASLPGEPQEIVLDAVKTP